MALIAGFSLLSSAVIQASCCKQVICSYKYPFVVGVVAAVVPAIYYHVSSGLGIEPINSLLEQNPKGDVDKEKVMPYDKAYTLSSHNSFTYPEKNNKEWSILMETALLQNQILDIKQQLKFGIRTFLIDIRIFNEDSKEVIKFSHEELNGIPLSYKKDWVAFLQDVESFLRNNPDEIITLHLESYVESYNKIMSYLKSVDLDRYLYVIESGSKDWDDINAMIKNDKRLLIFSDAEKDCGPGIMNTREYVLENHYEEEGCRYRDFKRLKIPKECVDNGERVYQCIKDVMLEHPAGENKGAVIFLMNHFYVASKIHYIKRVFPWFSEKEIKDYYGYLNSYERTKKKVQKCFCKFVIPQGALLSTRDDFVKTEEEKTVELGSYPNSIAIDFVGVDSNNNGALYDRGAKGVIEDMLSGNFTISPCTENL